MRHYRLVKDGVAIAWAISPRYASQYAWGRARGSRIEVQENGVWRKLGLATSD